MYFGRPAPSIFGSFHRRGSCSVVTASQTQAFQRFPFALKIFQGAVLIDIVSLKEAVDL